MRDRPVTDYSPETWRYLICKEFKLDYWTYAEQPQEWIEEIKLHWGEEALYAKENSRSTPGTGVTPHDDSRQRPGRLYNNS